MSARPRTRWNNDAVSTPQQPRPAVGGRRLISRYRLESVIGRGAMGTVWVAYDEVVHRRVAIKEINLPTGMPAGEVSMVTDRTLREARAIGALSHPHVITLYDILTVDGRPFIVMELLHARSLAQVLEQDGPLRDGSAAAVGLAVAGGLLAAHQAGITHRDVKPGNVLVGTDGRVKLTDFGIARSADEPTLTVTGLLLGSPAYISPEVASGRPASPAADAWGLGALLFAAVEGRPPFDRGDAIATLTAVVSAPVPPHPHSGRIGPVIDGLLTKDPAARMTVARAHRLLSECADDARDAGGLAGRASEDGWTGATAGQPSPPTQRTSHSASRLPPLLGNPNSGLRHPTMSGARAAEAAPRPAVPPPPWAGSGAEALQPLPTVSGPAGRPGWLLPVAVLLAVAVAVGAYFAVQLLADWGGRTAG